MPPKGPGASGPAKPRAQVPTSALGGSLVGQAQVRDRSGRISEYSVCIHRSSQSSDDKCPICKTDRYLSPRLRLMVSPCYHKMCESCIDRLFSLGPAACPVCGQIVRKQQFSAQIFEDLSVEEEVNVRKRVAKLFTRKPEEFASLRAYNDYLEEFEELTFNLVHKIDLEHTKARLAQYEALHRSAIAQQQQQHEQDSLRQAQLDEAERQERLLRAQKVREEQEREAAEREAEEREMVLELEKGRSIDEVLEERQRKREARALASQRREQEEQQRQQQFEARLRAAPQAQRTKLNAAEIEYIRAVAQSDFVGPFATLDDGTNLVHVRAAPVSLGGLGPGDGYVDPWLKPEWASRTAASQYRGGGYDWQHQVWQRGLQALCDGLALPPW